MTPTPFILCCTLLLSTTLLYAKDESIDFPQQLKTLQTAKTATVVLIRPSEIFPNGLVDEDYFKKIGCHFTTQDSALIADLVKVLKRSRIKKIAVDDSFLPVLGAGVYLTFANGTDAKFLFGREYVNEETVDGLFTKTPMFNEVPIIATRPLPEDYFNGPHALRGLL